MVKVPVQVKQLNLPRVGSNWLRYMLLANYEVDVLVNRAGWVHGDYFVHESLETKGQPLPVITVVKEPFAWLASIWRQVKKDGGIGMLRGEECDLESFASFLRSRIRFQCPERGHPAHRAANPVQYWNNRNDHYASLSRIISPRLDAVIVRYEHLLRDPETECEWLASRLKLQRKTSAFITTDQDTDGASDSPDVKTIVGDRPKFDRRSWYLDREYMKLYSDEDIAFVREQVDPDVVNALGYEDLAFGRED